MDQAEPRLAGSSAAVPASPEHDSSSGSSPDPVAAILKVLREGERFLVCSHSRPDGDAVASILALGMLIRQMGKRADLVTADSIPAVYRFLPEADSIRTALRVQGPYDAAILLECDSIGRTRLRGLDRFFAVNIDHHATGRPWAHLNWIDRDAASVGELVYRLILTAGVPVTPEIATCIYTTVLTDTGGFCYGPTRAATFTLAKELVESGANPILIAQSVYFSLATSKLLLLGAALRNLHHQGRLSWLWVTQSDMARSCASEEDCEGIANFALSIAGVEAAAFLRELPDRRIRVSLRSKGKVKVSAIAAHLGGGGHENAAGCTLDGPLDRAVEHILAEIHSHIATFAGESVADLKSAQQSELTGSGQVPGIKPGG